MALDILGREKPYFENDQLVRITIDGSLNGVGRIKGLASEGLIDIWIVEIDAETRSKTNYPWSCCTILHMHLIKIPG